MSELNFLAAPWVRGKSFLNHRILALWDYLPDDVGCGAWEERAPKCRGDSVIGWEELKHVAAMNFAILIKVPPGEA